MFRVISMMMLAVLLSACGATLTPIQDVKKDVKTVVFVQEGTKPFSMSFGVVDTSSFWATYGGQVSDNLGGSLIAAGAAADGQSTVMARRAQEAKAMEQILGNYPLVDELAKTLMPLVADKWGYPYTSKSRYVLKKGRVFPDKEGFMTGIKTKADLVLSFSVASLKLTERPTVGGAFAAGFSFGTSKKDVTGHPFIVIRAFKRDPATGRHKLARADSCSVHPVFMNVDVPFEEVMKEKDKVTKMWDDVLQVSKEKCAEVIAKLE